MDIDGAGIDEIAIVVEKMGGRRAGQQTLLVYEVPQTINGDALLKASYKRFGNSATDNNMIAIAGIDLNQDSIDEVAVIKQNLNDEQQAIYL